MALQERAQGLVSSRLNGYLHYAIDARRSHLTHDNRKLVTEHICFGPRLSNCRLPPPARYVKFP